MKASTKANLLSFGACVSTFVAIFADPLHLPSGSYAIFFLIAMLLGYLSYRVCKQMKQKGQVALTSDSQRRKTFWLTVAACAVVCIIMPFALPSAGVVLPFWELAVVSAFSFVVSVGCFWFGQRRRDELEAGQTRYSAPGDGALVDDRGAETPGH